jgi:hypothetical protein
MVGENVKGFEKSKLRDRTRLRIYNFEIGLLEDTLPVAVFTVVSDRRMGL